MPGSLKEQSTLLEFAKLSSYNTIFEDEI